MILKLTQAQLISLVDDVLVRLGHVASFIVNADHGVR